jgi:hypothetical protein
LGSKKPLVFIERLGDIARLESVACPLPGGGVLRLFGISIN